MDKDIGQVIDMIKEPIIWKIVEQKEDAKTFM